MTGQHLLVVEDEAPIRRFLRIALEANGYSVSEARSGMEALELCAERQPALVILDLGLPDLDGVAIIARLREWAQVPVLVLTVRSEESEKVRALDAGANDYITKPFGISELMARIRALLRDRAAEHAAIPAFEARGLRVDRVHRRVSVDGHAVHLSPKEYALLNLLIDRVGCVVTHRDILRSVWSPRQENETHYLRVLVGHLRRKLHENPSAPRFILTEPGVGYRFAED